MPIRKFEILNTPPERKYDNITDLAAYVCEASSALICLVHKDETWVKSLYGKKVDESTGVLAFCKLMVQSPKPFTEIQDAREHKKLKSRINISDGDPVFYAGYTLKDKQGNKLGVLCVTSETPKQLTNQQKNALIALGEQVETLFEIRFKSKILKDNRKELERHNALLKDFAGAVSHDLKMPLSSIIMTVDILKSKYANDLDDQAISYIDRLKRSSFGMSDYISNILAYYETETISSEDYSENPFGFKEFIESIIDMLNIESECEINTPENNFELICNRVGLEQIFLNLLGNSLKYNDKKKTVIDIEGIEEDGVYTFKVTDNGMGVPKSELNNIFNLFSTANERDRYGNKGNGIGLSTVHKLVEKLGGGIEVYSEFGKYTTFSFTIKKQKLKHRKTA